MVHAPPLSPFSNELARLDQALADLKRAEASEVSVIRCESPEHERVLVSALGRRARQAGFVTAAMSLETNHLEALDTVVRDFVLGLTPPTRSGASKQHGLLVLLDAFARRHGKKSGDIFAERVERLRASGDLTLLAEQYLLAHSEPKRHSTVFTAWLNGTELARRVRVPVPRAALSPKTARRALAELTRVVRALGFAGCALFLTEADYLARRTDRQREKSYTVLRELIDNFDAGRGMIATRLVVTGGPALFEGPKSLHSIAPLASRLRVPSDRGPAPPHRSMVTLDDASDAPSRLSEAPVGQPARSAAPANDPVDGEPARIAMASLPPPAAGAKPLRALIRISQGLPPTEAVASLSVAHEKIDLVITRLFEHAAMSGSVFSVLTGDYGRGKTHLLMHLAERALEARHPVFHLDVERLNLDLGNPQRHLSRLLEQSVMPLRYRPSALERAAAWTRSPAKLKELMRALEQIVESGSDAAPPAERALRAARKAKEPGPALEAFLTARGLDKKPASPAYRQDAYERLLLWIELLQRLDDCKGPVVLIDEAENLYTSGAARASRRTALRSLSFYCGGTLPSACVIVAVTPKVLKALRADARELLEEVSEQATVLPWEDADMLSRRLSRIKPEPVPEFTDAHRKELVERVIATHRTVRGGDGLLSAEDREELASVTGPPRELLRRTIDELERRWWASR